MALRSKQAAEPTVRHSAIARGVAGVAAMLLAAAGVSVLGLRDRSVRAQQLIPLPDGVEGVKGKESTENVFVRDSAIAKEKFDLAVKMERLKEWNKSADLYQEVLEKYSDRVIPDGTDAGGVINRYTSVTRGVLDRLCKWPEGGLAVYRGRYGPKAAQLLESGSTDDLHKAYDDYFVTEAGKVAGLRLVDASLEAGEYQAAAWRGDQLLNLHPDLIVERPAVLFRTALAYSLAGQTEKAHERAGQLAKDFPKEMGVVRGKDALLTQALDELMQQDRPGQIATASADSVPMFGGNPQRNLISASHASAGTPLYKVPLARAEFRNVNPQLKGQIKRQMEMAAGNGLTLGIMPVADRGELFFQDGLHVYAVSLASGVPLPGWTQTYGGAQEGRYTLGDTWGTPRMAQQTLTLTSRQVLAVMGQPDRQAQMLLGMGIGGEAKLVSLDRATGKQNWVVSLSSAELPKDLGHDEQTALRTLQFSGSPLVVGDSVLSIARSNRQNGAQTGEDCYVVSFDLNTGKFRWSCYIASSGMGPGAMYGVAASNGDNTSHLAYANGRVYVVTNLGALAALDAYGGSIVWLNIYPVDRPDIMDIRRGFNPMFAQGGNGSAGGKSKPWQFNPLVIQDGMLFMLPTDSKYLMIYDAGTGKEVKRINLLQLGDWSTIGNSEWKRDKPTTLVGVKGENLVLAGDTRVLCIDWKKYDEATFPGADESMIVWPSTVVSFIRGRCFMTGDSVYIPTDTRLLRQSLVQGRVIESYPSSAREWEENEGPGNMIVVGDHVIVAGAKSVEVYTDVAVAKAKLDAELVASPNDPDPRLRYAEVMFVAGQADQALQRLDEAALLLGGMDHLSPGPARDRVFNDALMFAQKLSGDDRAGARQRATEFFNRAGAAAASPQQQVYYRMSRAKFAADTADPTRAVTLYQEILSSDSMRAVSLMDEQSGIPSQAEDVAERSIEGMIKRAGVEIYAPYQQAAAAAMTESQGEADPAARANKLLAVAQQYPNSGVAPQAMLGAADAYETAGQPRPAIRVLRQTWFKYPQGSSRAQVLESMARNYLAVTDRRRDEMTSTAAARLAQGASLPGDPKLTKSLKLPDGTVIAEAGQPLAKALDEVRKLSGKEAGKTLPDFKLPTPLTLAQKEAGVPYPRPFKGMKVRELVTPDVSVELPGANALVMPARDFARADRVVTWGKGLLQIFPAAGAQPLASSAAFPDAGRGVGDSPRGVAWAGESALVWGSTKLVSLAGDGKTAWEIDLARLPMIDVVRPTDSGSPSVAGGNGEVFVDNNNAVLNGPVRVRNAQRLVINGQVQALGNGLVLPGQPAAPAAPPVALPPQPVPGIGEQVAEIRPVGDRVLVTTSLGRLLSVEVAGGKIAWQTRPAEKAPDRLVATEDFTVVKVSDDANVRLFALDTYSGRLIGTKGYSVAGANMAPVNLALSADGTLVYTLPDRLCLKDLYKGWNEEEKTVPGGQPGLYAGATQLGQLLIAEGRILALADNGNEKYVRVHSLETGQPLQLRYTLSDGSNREVDQLLTAGTKDWNVQLRAVGPHLYVVGPQSVFGYNLDRPAATWRGATMLREGAKNDVDFRDVFVGQNYLVVLDQPPVVPSGAQNYRLHAYARVEGRMDYPALVTDPAGIAPQWQACDGSFYYTTLDGKVRMLLGAK